jgi:hypothetical protein
MAKDRRQLQDRGKARRPRMKTREFPGHSPAERRPHLICLRIRRRCRRRRRWRHIRGLHSEWNFFRNQHPSHYVGDFHHWKNQHAQNHSDDAGGRQVPSVSQSKRRTHAGHHSLGLRPIHGAQRRRRVSGYIGGRAATGTEAGRCRQWLSTLVTEHNTTPPGRYESRNRRVTGTNHHGMQHFLQESCLKVQPRRQYDSAECRLPARSFACAF